MPVLSVLAPKVHAAVSGAVGALLFIFPVTAGPVGVLGGAGHDHGHATAIRPPASSRVVQSAGLFAIACAAAGSCTAGGDYAAAGGPIEPMVATQSHDRWSRGIALRLPAGAAAQPYARVNGVACRSAGNCVAVGDYEYGGSRNLQAFIATESRGVWARAFTPRLPPGAASPVSAQLEAVSCARDGSCTAVGSYQDSSGNAQTMTLAKPPSGPWRQATEIAAPRGAIASTFTAITSISCLSAGPCLGAGQYAVSATQSRAMAVIESGGRFGRAWPITAVPRGAGPRASTYLLGVSCRPSGVCFAVGGGRNAAGHSVAMYLVRSGGRWRAGFLPAPAGATTGKGQLSALYSVSCTGRARCNAVGYYNDWSGDPHADAAATP